MSLKAFETIKRFNMLSPLGNGSMQTDKLNILVGLSGGADSMTLLHLLCAMRGQISVYAAHVNHGIRGEEAKRDENFVKDVCEKWDVPLFVLHADIPAEASKTGETEEEAGRRIRYQFFNEKAKELSAKIATAHTLSDSMETVLINLSRGTGAKGLCGIPPIRNNIIRPLIFDTRAEIEYYTKQNEIPFVTDSTNLERAYTRNRIRLDVVPVLYDINASFDKTFARFINNMKTDENYLSNLARISFENAKTQKGLDTKSLLKLDPAIRNRVLTLAVVENTGMEPETVHIDEINRILYLKDGKTQIRGGFFAVVKNNNLQFIKKTDRKPDDFHFELKDENYQNQCFFIKIKTLYEEEIKNYKKIHKQYFKNAIDCDKIKNNAVIRSKKNGDCYRPAGRGVTKSLKKLFNESHIPVSVRNSIPVASDSEGILWVYGFGPDERCAVSEETTKAILFDIKILEGNCLD